MTASQIAGVSAIRDRIGEITTRIESLGSSFAAAKASSTASAATASTASATSTASDFASVLAGADLSTATGVDALIAAATAKTATAATTSTATGDALVAEARKYLGVPYVLGGTTAAGLDCSGLVQRALGALGVDMPRVAREQMTTGTPVASLADAVPGDLLVFNGGSHIAIYTGNGKMIDAPQPGDVVRERDVYATPTAIRRVVGTGSTTLAASAAASMTSSAASLQEILAASSAQRSALSLRLGDAA
ncbi:Cell wall-associated hydrolase, NlpC family [Sanguibacter gelidistatuariae]|uniref:Cell wall-associated hydrolase, NlpC family n=1 Tax=Sanguibacter gelidistatuariae TaxID=1814289 RepID=A0A1G6PZ90_9MICO|nr:C40 family peptidase [Sanguibacter gelidistatuariae]SDC84705.1 Cell wall-associated hydrolase, NlpC family [Sanguibacter gelidistatuariae]